MTIAFVCVYTLGNAAANIEPEHALAKPRRRAELDSFFQCGSRIASGVACTVLGAVNAFRKLDPGCLQQRLALQYSRGIERFKGFSSGAQ
ncbi:hypothetical protein D3C79_1013800 [compost metagenome]